MRNDCKQYGEQRVGEVNYNKSGLRMEIIQYDNTSNIVIRLDNGYVHKNEKECYIKSVADKYKNILPQEVYNALYEWKVELID